MIVGRVMSCSLQRRQSFPCPENESLELVPPAVGREEQGRVWGELLTNGWSPPHLLFPAPVGGTITELFSLPASRVF